MTGSHGNSEPAASGDGTVYLIHFDEPYKHARHYTGWTPDLPARLEDHRKGRGARLMQVIKDAGISWHVTRTWPGSRNLERAIKNQHNAPHLCPECTPQPRPVANGPTRAARREAPAQQPAPQTHVTDSWAQLPEQAPARSPAIEQSPARASALIVPEPGTEPSSPWTGRPAPASVYRDLWDVTEQLIDGWLAQQRAPEPEPELEID